MALSNWSTSYFSGKRKSKRERSEPSKLPCLASSNDVGGLYRHDWRHQNAHADVHH